MTLANNSTEKSQKLAMPITPENLLGTGRHATEYPPEHPRSAENIARRKALRIVEFDTDGKILPGSVMPGAGRPKGATITTIARQYTDEAINVLAEVMRDPKAPQPARVTAAQALIDRGWGKAPIQIDLNIKAKFDDFLREVGDAAVYEHEHPVAQAISAAIDEASPQNDANEEPGTDES